MSYESAMEERILKTFKSKDDLIRKLQTEIDVTYGKAFVAGKKNGEETMQDEIAELVNMLLYCNPVPAKKTQYEALMDKHNYCNELVRWATKIINEEIEHGYTSKQTLDEGQELVAKHKGE